MLWNVAKINASLFQPPSGFSPKARGGRDLSCHGSYSSLPRDARDQTPPRAEGSPVHGYTSIEVTNVWHHGRVRDISKTYGTDVTTMHLNMRRSFCSKDEPLKNRLHFFEESGFLKYVSRLIKNHSLWTSVIFFSKPRIRAWGSQAKSLFFYVLNGLCEPWCHCAVCFVVKTETNILKDCLYDTRYLMTTLKRLYRCI